MSTRDAPFMKADERAEPLVFDAITGPHVRFTASRRDLMGGPVVVNAKGRTDAQLATSIMEFSAWWVTEVAPRLNGFGGWGCIEWKVLR